MSWTGNTQSLDDIKANTSGITNAINLTSSNELISLNSILTKLGTLSTQATELEELAKLEAIRALLATGLVIRSDAQAKARAGAIASTCSGDVSLVLAFTTNMLQIANPAGSGKTIYLAWVSSQANVAGSIQRFRGSTLTGGSVVNGTANFAGVTGATVRTGGTINTGTGTREAVTLANQVDTTPSGIIRIGAGESLSWAMQPALVGVGVVSVAAWSE